MKIKTSEIKCSVCGKKPQCKVSPDMIEAMRTLRGRFGWDKDLDKFFCSNQCKYSLELEYLRKLKENPDDFHSRIRVGGSDHLPPGISYEQFLKDGLDPKIIDAMIANAEAKIALEQQKKKDDEKADTTIEYPDVDTCPFCGAKAVWYCSVDEGNYAHVRIQCSNKRMPGFGCCFFDQSIDEESKQKRYDRIREAIKLVAAYWNRRADVKKKVVWFSSKSRFRKSLEEAGKGRHRPMFVRWTDEQGVKHLEYGMTTMEDGELQWVSDGSRWEFEKFEAQMKEFEWCYVDTLDLL